MSVHDWRRTPNLKVRSFAAVKRELANARFVEITPSGVVLELPSGERVEYGAAGYDYDMELTDG